MRPPRQSSKIPGGAVTFSDVLGAMAWTSSSVGVTRDDGLEPVVLRLLPSVHAPPARVLLAGGSVDGASGLVRRGYRAQHVPADADLAQAGPVDVVVEQGSFAQLDPSQRDAWIAALADVVVEGGYLIGAFLAFSGGGPPYGTSAAELRSRLDADFELVSLEPSAFRHRASGLPQLEVIARRR